MKDKHESDCEKKVQNKIFATGFDDYMLKKVQEELPEENRNIVPVSFLELFRFASAGEKLCALMGCLCAICAGTIQPNVLFIGGIIAGIYTSKEDKILNDDFWNSVTFYLHILVILGAADTILSFLQIRLLRHTCNGAAKQIRREYLRAVLRQDAEWFDRNATGTVVARLNDNIERYTDGVGDKIGMLLSGFSMFACSIALGFWYEWRITLVMFTIGPLSLAIMFVMNKMTTSDSYIISEVTASAGAVLEESVVNVATVAACCGQEQMTEKYRTTLMAGEKFVKRFNVVMGFFFGCSVAVNYAVTGIALCFAIYLYHNDIIHDPGSVMAIINAVGYTAYIIGLLGPHMMSILKARIAAAVLYEAIDRVPQSSSCKAEARIKELKGAIRFTDVKFKYPTRDAIVLNGASWHADVGESIALVGGSGCGKSTSVGLITGLYKATEGAVTIDGHNVNEIDISLLRKKIGIVEQEPKLFNGTIMENIVVGREISVDDAITAAVTANCHDFINALEMGYDTRLGPGGVSLSGGQKQRIAIARAICADPKILLLDEATSALDSHSELIVQKALNRAAEGRTTVIIAHRLSTLRDVNRIYVMEKGAVVEVGTHQELVEKDGLYSKMAKQQDLEKRKISTAPEPLTFSLPNTSRLLYSSIRSNVSSKIDTGTESVFEEEAKTSQSKPGLYACLTKYSTNTRKYLIAGLAIPIISAIEIPIYTYILARGAASFQVSHEEYVYGGIVLVALSFFVAGLVVFHNTAESYLLGISSSRIVNNISALALRSLLYKDVSYFDDPKKSRAQSVAIITQHANNCIAGLNRNLGFCMMCTIGILFLQIYTYYTSLYFGLLATGLGSIMAVMVFSSIIGVMKNRRNLQKHDTTQERILEMVGQAKTIQLLVAEPFFMRRFIEEDERIQKYHSRIALLEAINYAVIQSFVFFGDALCFAVGMIFIYYGRMHPNDTYLAVLCTEWVPWFILYLAPYFPEFVKASHSAKTLLSLVDDQNELEERINRGEKPIINNGSVTVRNVKFAYPSRPDHLVAIGMNVSVRKALVGASGCGKSSLLNLLERFYFQDGGSILVDNTQIETINIHHLRRHIGLVSQQPVLLSGTILENILLGCVGVTREEVKKACVLANANDFIEMFPLGYDTEVGHDGSQLSGGQKQRIAIARAIVRQPPILLLDEATSALDTQSEEVVQRALNEASKGRTCIVVAHRLSTIQNCDRIYFIENGTVAESGTHQELLEHDGKYAKLVKAQMLGSE